MAGGMDQRATDGVHAGGMDYRGDTGRDSRWSGSSIGASPVLWPDDSAILWPDDSEMDWP